MKFQQRALLPGVWAEAEQINKLKELSKKTRIPLSAYIREGLELVLQANEPEKSGGYGDEG